MDNSAAPGTQATGSTGAASGLSRWRIAAFALPAAPIAAMGLPIVVYLPPFYADEMGLGLALVGTIFMYSALLYLLCRTALHYFTVK